MKPSASRVGWSIAIIIAVVIAVIVSLAIYSAYDMVGCDITKRDLARNRRGDRLALEEQSCSGFGASVAVTIRLQQADSGAAEEIFAYEPYFGLRGLPQPQATWLNEDHALIRIARVGEVFHQRSHLGRYTIQYRIGRVGN